MSGESSGIASAIGILYEVCVSQECEHEAALDALERGGLEKFASDDLEAAVKARYKAAGYRPRAEAFDNALVLAKDGLKSAENLEYLRAVAKAFRLSVIGLRARFGFGINERQEVGKCRYRGVGRQEHAE